MPFVPPGSRPCAISNLATVRGHRFMSILPCSKTTHAATLRFSLSLAAAPSAGGRCALPPAHGQSSQSGLVFRGMRGAGTAADRACAPSPGRPTISLVGNCGIQAVCGTAGRAGERNARPRCTRPTSSRLALRTLKRAQPPPDPNRRLGRPGRTAWRLDLARVELGRASTSRHAGQFGKRRGYQAVHLRPGQIGAAGQSQAEEYLSACEAMERAAIDRPPMGDQVQSRHPGGSKGGQLSGHWTAKWPKKWSTCAAGSAAASG